MTGSQSRSFFVPQYRLSARVIVFPSYTPDIRPVNILSSLSRYASSYFIAKDIAFAVRVDHKSFRASLFKSGTFIVTRNSIIRMCCCRRSRATSRAWWMRRGRRWRRPWPASPARTTRIARPRRSDERPTRIFFFFLDANKFRDTVTFRPVTRKTAWKNEEDGSRRILDSCWLISNCRGIDKILRVDARSKILTRLGCEMWE